MSKLLWYGQKSLTLLLMVGSFVLTAFIFSNSYELLFNRDLPYVQAIGNVDMQGVSLGNITNQELEKSKTPEFEGGFGAPFSIKLPIQKIRLPLISAIFTEQGWLARTNTGHYFITTPSKNNNLGTTVLYMRKSWRTVPNPEDLKTGENIFVDTNRDWRYMYRITEVNVLPYDEQYIIEDSRLSKMVMIIDDQTHHVHYIVSSEIVSVQNIQQ